MKDGAQRQPVTSDIELTLDTSSIISALQDLQFTELTGLFTYFSLYPTMNNSKAL